MRRLFRRSRAFRIVCYAALAPVWVLVALVSSNTLSGYTATGNVVMVVAVHVVRTVGLVVRGGS